MLTFKSIKAFNSVKVTSCKCMFLVNVSSKTRCSLRLMSRRLSSEVSLTKSITRLSAFLSPDGTGKLADPDSIKTHTVVYWPLSSRDLMKSEFKLERRWTLNVYSRHAKHSSSRTHNIFVTNNNRNNNISCQNFTGFHSISELISKLLHLHTVPITCFWSAHFGQPTLVSPFWSTHFGQPTLVNPL